MLLTEAPLLDACAAAAAAATLAALPELLSDTDVAEPLLFDVAPDAAPPAFVLLVAEAEPEFAVWLLPFVTPTPLLFVALTFVLLVLLAVVVEPGPVVSIVVWADARPAVRLMPKTVAAAARISCFFIKTSLR